MMRLMKLVCFLLLLSACAGNNSFEELPTAETIPTATATATTPEVAVAATDTPLPAPTATTLPSPTETIPVPSATETVPAVPTESAVPSPTETVLAPTETVLAPTETVLAPTETVLAPTETVLAPTETVLGPTETPFAPTETPLAPTETVLAPTETPLAPTETPFAPTEAPLAPTETPLPLPTETVVRLPLATETAPPPTVPALPTETLPALPTQTVPPPPTETVVALPTETLPPPPTETVAALPTETLPPPPTETVPPATATFVPPTATFVPPTATPEPFVAGVRCFRPPDDYRRTQVRGHTLNVRTVAMMDNAQALYGGRGSMRLVIQGSYAAGLGASFGTHDAGGAVDIWTVDPNNTAILLDDIDQMVWALRQSGFSAWFRPANMLYQGMYPHIHAIAVGDQELSASAMAQLTGEQGYFRGRNGLPQAEFMGADPHGGPILCPWMQEEGYQLLSYGSQESEPPSNNEEPNEEEAINDEPDEANAPNAVACQAPTDDYRRINVNGHTLNQRTHSMLQTAQALYNGPGNLLAITQGSYNYGVTASFGTHDAGGAVDISIRDPQTSEYLYGEANNMVLALRQAGFAAWYRSPEQGFAPHIHAIAIGDAELSDAAAAQLTGEQGYFRGRNGLPDNNAGADSHGGPWVCDWMKEIGYRDLR